MNFENLAHGAFAMLGGDACVVLLDGFGVRFLATLPIVASVSALVGVVLERTPYRRLYGASHLDQGLFSIGLVWFCRNVGDALLFWCATAALVQPWRSR